MSRKRKNFGVNISPGAVVVVLVILYFGVLIRSGWLKNLELKEEKAGLEGQIGQLSKDKALLEKRISVLKTPDQIELVARQKLGMVKSGETAYKVVLEPKTKKMTAVLPSGPKR